MTKESRQGKLADNKMKFTCVSDKEDIEIFKKIAKHKGLSASALMNTIIVEYVRNNKDIL